jgi:hypothetical protein
LSAFIFSEFLGSGNSVALPLKHHFSLKLGNRPEHGEHQLSGRG